MKREAIGLLAALGLVTSLDADWRRPTTWPRLEPGIPKREYKFIEPSATPAPPPVVGASLDAIEIGDTAKKPKLRTFAMDRTELRSLHCSIAQVQLAIQNNGDWLFNATAHQNPWFTTEPSSLPPARLAGILKVETNYLVRNEFTIRVRCYGNSPLREAVKTTGKPLLVEIPLTKVWVQRGVPLAIKEQSKEPVKKLEEYYSLIERVEFELSIR